MPLTPTLLLYIIIVLVLADFMLERILSYYNRESRSTPIPNSLEGIYKPEEYRRSQEYHGAQAKAGVLSSSVSVIGSLILLSSGAFGWLSDWLLAFGWGSTLTTLAFFACIGVASSLISLPFAWHSTFVIEERFGFNKMTPSLFWADWSKQLLLGAILGGGLLAAFVWLHNNVDGWWLYAWLLFMSISLLFASLYTTLLVPLFNKLEPLQEGDLRTAIMEYASKVNFPLKNIMVIDGSKRSTKANAYFSGFGGTKTIVLYDTLIDSHTIPELVAVLAHEVGHYKKKHIFQGMGISALQLFITLWVMQRMVDEPMLSQALGAQHVQLHLGLIGFSILYSPLSTATALLMNVFSRKNEYEADAYAATTYESAPLADALKKMSADSLSNLTPHPAFVFFHYSHPPLAQRLAALEAANA